MGMESGVLVEHDTPTVIAGKSVEVVGCLDRLVDGVAVVMLQDLGPLFEVAS
jgi:hypothetical protein